MSSLVSMLVRTVTLSVPIGFWAFKCVRNNLIATTSLGDKATDKQPAKQVCARKYEAVVAETVINIGQFVLVVVVRCFAGPALDGSAVCCIQVAEELPAFISDFAELFSSRVKDLKNDLECSQQQLATLQQELDQQRQDHAQIQQLLEENAKLKDSIHTQAAAGALREQQLHDQVHQEQECSSSLSIQLQESTDSLSLLQSQHDSMVAAGQSLCSVAQAGDARIAHLEECNAALQQERDVLAVMYSALTAQLGSSTAKGAYTAHVPAATLTAFRPADQQQAEGAAQQQQEQELVLQPCSPSRIQELPQACISGSVWGSSSSSPSFSGSCCGGDSEPTEVWSCFNNSAWECY